MRPRIKRPSTRDGHEGQQKDYRTNDRTPFREGSRRPDRKFSGDSRPEHHRSRPGQENRPAYGDRPAHGSRPGRDSRPANSRPSNGRPGRDGKPGYGRKPERDSRPAFRNGNAGQAGKGFQHKVRTAHSRPAQAPAQPLPLKENDGLVRLNKFIANSGICSRREADEYITAGLVTVNGNVVTELGVKIRPEEDDVRFNGERLRGEKKVYVLLNKPKDFVTTTSDPHAEKNVMQLISRDLCPERIFPVGRLDRTTTGVLLLTNDGELAERLTHPSYQKKKIYQVTLDKNVKQEDMNRLVEGVSLEDGPAYADEVAYNGDDRSVVGIEIHSGRNRIVRRMFEALGYKVRKLDRVYFAGLTKKNLRRGQWRFLTEEEATMLKLNFYE